MFKPSPRLTFNFTAFLAAAVVALAPLAASYADAITTPNSINNAFVDTVAPPDPSTGVYDNYDKHRDPKAFPQGGWQYLTLPPS